MSSPQSAGRGDEGNGGPPAVAAPSPLENELARLDQALYDLKTCEGSEVVLVRCAAPDLERRLVGALTARARRQGFATATLSLAEHGLDALDDLVRAVVEGLETRRGLGRGLLSQVGAFAARHPRDAGLRFARAAERWGAVGDLSVLCRQLLDEESAEGARAELAAWLLGTELGRVDGHAMVRGALGERTARRALAEVTRLVRALGHGGLLLCLVDGDRVARRTPRQRERSYTLLRELIDNFDGGRGMTSTRLVITGGARLFEGPTSLRSLPALASRVEAPGAMAPPPPHRTRVDLALGARARSGPRPALVGPGARRALRALIRAAQGLPPTEAVASLSVGHERIDELIRALLEHARLAGSAFWVLVGDYGTGKTHLLLHLADRALAAGHPVFRLNLERLGLDLGNPARHLRRLLDDSELPGPRGRSALEWLARITRSPAGCASLLATLERIAAEPGDGAPAARRALRAARSGRSPAHGVEAYLGARDLEGRAGAPAHRREAYARLLLWIELLRRLQGWQGPVLLIDEAENLFVSGVSRALRRTALRSLSFYCGGALPSTSVVMTSTPRALGRLRYEAGELLHDVSTRAGSLEWEDADMLRHRLMRLVPQPVPALTREHRAELAARVVATHAEVRGAGAPLDVAPWLDEPGPPRMLVRRLIDELEARWWRARRFGAAGASAPDPAQPPLESASRGGNGQAWAGADGRTPERVG